MVRNCCVLGYVQIAVPCALDKQKWYGGMVAAYEVRVCRARTEHAAMAQDFEIKVMRRGVHADMFFHNNMSQFEMRFLETHLIQLLRPSMNIKMLVRDKTI